MGKDLIIDVDTSKVIAEVRKRKCLWDLTDQMHRNREARIKAWDEITDVIAGDAPQQEKEQIGRLIQQRWKTARDAFCRTRAGMRNQTSGSSSKKIRKYLFYEDLLFLDPSASTEVEYEQEEPMKSSSPEVYLEYLDTEENVASPEISESENTQYVEPTTSQNPWVLKAANVPQTNQAGSFEREFVSMMSNQSSDLASDDLAFFFSLGPILRNFDLEQKVEFRTKVMREAIRMLRNPL